MREGRVHVEYVVLVKRKRCFQCEATLPPGDVVVVEDDHAFCMAKGCLDVYRVEQEKGAKR